MKRHLRKGSMVDAKRVSKMMNSNATGGYCGVLLVTRVDLCCW